VLSEQKVNKLINVFAFARTAVGAVSTQRPFITQEQAFTISSRRYGCDHLGHTLSATQGNLPDTKDTSHPKISNRPRHKTKKSSPAAAMLEKECVSYPRMGA